MLSVESISQLLREFTDLQYVWTIRAILNGGGGSGNFNHLGNSPNIGGSSGGGLRAEITKVWVDKYKDEKVEHYIILKEDGSLVTGGKGDKDSAIVDTTNAKDNHLVHNHPLETESTMSPNDINLAIKADLASIASSNVNGGILTVTRPETGWPNLNPTDIEVAHVKALLDTMGLKEELKIKILSGQMSIVEAASKVGHTVTIKMLEDLGLK